MIDSIDFEFEIDLNVGTYWRGVGWEPCGPVTETPALQRPKPNKGQIQSPAEPAATILIEHPTRGGYKYVLVQCNAYVARRGPAGASTRLGSRAKLVL